MNWRALATCEPWLREILVDPIGKDPLVNAGENLRSTYGREYPRFASTWDLRRTSWAPFQKRWHVGQDAFEQWSDNERTWFDAAAEAPQLTALESVYRELPLNGRVLDLGGHQGRLRKFLSPGQEYVVVEPFLGVFRQLEHPPESLLRVYPFLTEPVNVLGGHAEHVPIASGEFDTVHIRSVLDHLFDPALALCEARRLLSPGGRLIVGTYVKGGRRGRVPLVRVLKDAAHVVLASTGAVGHVDHHLWHPTYDELCDAIRSAGFELGTTVWQAGCDDHVCYVEGRTV